MKPIDRLLKFLSVPNIADEIDEDLYVGIVKDVITGYEIDDSSRMSWLDTNKQALKIIACHDDDDNSGDKTFPFDRASKVIYPLIQPAVIQLASRMIQHLVANGRVAECRVLGEDQELMIPDPKNPQGPPKASGKGIKEAKAERVSDYLSFQLLVESQSWLLEQHKLCHIVAAWGVGFQELFYDEISHKVSSEILNPEDVILNNNITSLEKARRITIRLYMTKNDIIERQRAGKFLSSVDVDKLDQSTMDSMHHENDAQETDPTYEILRQFCYLDLADDGMKQPYWVFVHQYSNKLLGIYPAFKFDTIETSEKGEILGIKPTMNIVDMHLIDNPNGNYYSLGLNQLLLHTNKSITSILRQLLDAGILSNTAGSTGFVTKAFKTKERSLRMKLGEFKVLDVPMGTEIEKQIMNLPFKEPSQVLLALLQFMVESGEKNGFISDILSGDAANANVPATTMLAMIEQATRAFRPVVQKQQQALKQVFKIWFTLTADHFDAPKYIQFQGVSSQICKDDFDLRNLDIAPVADPTMSSEAHKYARMQFIIQLIQQVPGGLVIPEVLERLLTGIEEPSPEMLIAPPAPPPPNPQLLEVQLKGKIADQDNQIKQLEQQLKAIEVDNKTKLVGIKQQELDLKKKESGIKTADVITEHHREALDLLNKHEMTKIQGYNAVTTREKVNVMKDQAEKDREHEKDINRMNINSKDSPTP